MSRPLYRGCPLFGGSVIRGFTVTRAMPGPAGAYALAVTLWLSKVVVDWTFTSVGVDVRTRLFVDRRRVNVY